MGWSWVSLSTLPPHLCGPLSITGGCVLLQMKLPASLLGPYSHMPTASGWGWPPPSVPPPPPAPAPPAALPSTRQVAVSPDGTVDARRATGSSSAEYLRQLSMSQRSNGVFINDPKGLFILRWYREVKGDGTPPDGPRYQNRACKYYKLTSDNDGEAFRWTSNYQIISTRCT